VALGGGSAVLSGVVLLAIEKQQWIWAAASVLAVVVTALCYSLLRSTQGDVSSMQDRKVWADTVNHA
jgi:hypothetical protein